MKQALLRLFPNANLLIGLTWFPRGLGFTHLGLEYLGGDSVFLGMTPFDLDNEDYLKALREYFLGLFPKDPSQRAVQNMEGFITLFKEALRLDFQIIGLTLPGTLSWLVKNQGAQAQVRGEYFPSEVSMIDLYAASQIIGVLKHPSTKIISLMGALHVFTEGVPTFLGDEGISQNSVVFVGGEAPVESMQRAGLRVQGREMVIAKVAREKGLGEERFALSLPADAGYGAKWAVHLPQANPRWTHEIEEIEEYAQTRGYFSLGYTGQSLPEARVRDRFSELGFSPDLYFFLQRAISMAQQAELLGAVDFFRLILSNPDRDSLLIQGFLYW